MAQQTKPKRGPGRPPKTIPGIPDTLENVVKALVQPVEQQRKHETERVG